MAVRLSIAFLREFLGRAQAKGSVEIVRKWNLQVMKCKAILTEKANGRIKKAFRRKKSLFATVELRTMAVESNFNFLLFDSNVVDSV